MNTKAFQQTNLLVAAWDTLGWILFLEGKPAEAAPYLAAAWLHQPSLTVGNHLAQAKEALGKPSEALTIDELAAASEQRTTDQESKKEVSANADRLRKAGATSSTRNAVQALQEMRTFHIDRPKTLKGSGTYRVQLGGTGITDSYLVQGDDSLRPLGSKLLQIKIPGAVPPGSQARLVRDAVLNCSDLFPTCELVFMPYSGLRMEGIR